jgi:hypothetical protein
MRFALLGDAERAEPVAVGDGVREWVAIAGCVHHEVAPVAGHDGARRVAVGAPAHGTTHTIAVLHLHGLSILRRHFISSIPRLFFE